MAFHFAGYSNIMGACPSWISLKMYSDQIILKLHMKKPLHW